MSPDVNRRDFVKAAGAAGAGVAFTGTASAAEETVSAGLDPDGGLQEAIVVFQEREQVSLLEEFDLVEGYHAYRVLPMAYTRLRGEQISRLADREAVLHVSETFDLEYYNDAESRQAMHVQAVNAAAFGETDTLGYAGEGIDAVVIDSGVDGSHPDFQGRIESNYEYVDSPLGDREPTWVDVGPGDSDDIGHGQHCCGIVAGDGFASTTAGTGPYVGMAPEARLSAYSVSQTLYLPYAVGAWDHMLARKRDPDDEFDPVVCSNSYGVARGNRYNPLDPLNVATWMAFQEGVVPVFALGNDGPGKGTVSRYAKAPHVLGVAAGTKDRTVTDFSSRGRDVGDALPGGGTLEAGSPHHDRAALLSNLECYFEVAFGERLLVDDGTFSGEAGPGVTAPYGLVHEDAGATTHELEVPANADLLEGHLSLTPDGQQLQVSFYRNYGEDDEELLARMGEEPVYIHRDVALDVPGGETVTVEFRPGNEVAVQYEFEWSLYDAVDVSDGQYFAETLADQRPVTLYRPGVVTHGNLVMSTFDPEDALAPTATSEDSLREPFYGRISGTSMACPGAAGIVALVVEAGRDAGLEFVGHGSDRAGDADTFTPLDVVYTVEATAVDAHEAYTPGNAGPGFVHAEAAVERAAAGEFAGPAEAHASLADPGTPTALSVAGSRGDDGAAFTAGSTDQVDVTLASVETPSVSQVTVYDFVPASWRVVGGDATVVYDPDSEDSAGDVPTKAGAKTVELGTTGGGETFTYFVEAPSSSGQYTFGPATAETDADVDQPRATFGGTDTNTVAAPPSAE